MAYDAQHIENRCRERQIPVPISRTHVDGTRPSEIQPELARSGTKLLHTPDLFRQVRSAEKDLEREMGEMASHHYEVVPCLRVEAPFEDFLLRLSPTLLAYLMGWLEESSAAKIGQLNVRLRYLYNTYSRSTWNIMSFLEHYVSRPYQLLCSLDVDSALVYGEAVLAFFLRGETSYDELDICATLSHFDRIREALESDGYRLSKSATRYRDTQTSVQGEIERLVGKALSTAPRRWSLTGDLSSEPKQHLGFKFPFPAALACYVSYNMAVHLFARSTIIDEKSYAFPNYSILNKNRSRRGKDAILVKGRHSSRELEILHGPPRGVERGRISELGHRYIGDEMCWIIRRDFEDPMLPIPRYKGPRFEVVDWLTFWDSEGSYMRIGEPFVLSSKYAHTLRQKNAASNVERGYPASKGRSAVSSTELSELSIALLLRSDAIQAVKCLNSVQTHDIDIVVFPFESQKTEMWSTTAYVSQEGEHPEENIDLRDLFPYGGLSVLMCTNPGSGNPLPYAYRIFVDNFATPRPINRSVDAMFDRPWIGNVVVAKYAKTSTAARPSFTSMPRAEADIMVALVGDWLEMMWNEMFGVIDGWPAIE
ncbi:hypothetical protein DFP72DRAFT_845131 [Ephemerocybe angulata]|uniref:Uncharacterized protein n=1 Tax=Ephemerocybe angulata TaxID=980116 RepID=A0A8H6M9T5_9AGAR|nr:hypothetical protein DFP72DRAFT_845131 [Tulosesus angulatus]